MANKTLKHINCLSRCYFNPVNLNILPAQNLLPDSLKVSETKVQYRYSFCLLTRGKYREQSPEEVNKIQEGHRVNLSNPKKTGHLWLADSFDFKLTDRIDWIGLVSLRASLNQEPSN
jgi:hypothetical protein